MSTKSEKRRHPRRALRLPVKSRGTTAPDGQLHDISAGGLFFHTPARPEVGEALEIEIPPQGKGAPIKATVQVTRVTSQGVGAYFTDLDPDSALLLNHLLAQ